LIFPNTNLPETRFSETDFPGSQKVFRGDLLHFFVRPLTGSIDPFDAIAVLSSIQCNPGHAEFCGESAFSANRGSPFGLKYTNLGVQNSTTCGQAALLSYSNASTWLKTAAWLTMLCLSVPLLAQNATQSAAPAPHQAQSVSDTQSSPMRTTREKWNHFVHETVSPLTFGGGTFNAAFSQVTNTDPKYGVNRVAFGERLGASIADIASQNFFGDFMVASALHEDPRYFRKGEGHPLLYRAGYAISRALVIRRDDGGNTFNFDNVLGSALSSSASNIYYPAASRTRRAFIMHFWIDIADNGLVNLAPEFWPDFRRKVLRRHHQQ
jgi:hypothetical protein